MAKTLKLLQGTPKNGKLPVNVPCACNKPGETACDHKNNRVQTLITGDYNRNTPILSRYEIANRFHNLTVYR
jgi:hypothetical protein